MIAFKHLVTRSVTRIFLRGQYFDHVPMPTRRHSRWFSLLPVGNRMYLYSLSRWIVYGMKLAHVHVCVTRLRFLPFRLVDPCVREDFSFRLFFFLFFLFPRFATYLEKFGFRADVSEVFCLPLFMIQFVIREKKNEKKGGDVDRVCSFWMLQIFFIHLYLLFLKIFFDIFYLIFIWLWIAFVR